MKATSLHEKTLTIEELEVMRPFKTAQAWNVIQHFALFVRKPGAVAREYRLRVSITRDAYDAQSFVRVEVWGDTRWNLCADVPWPHAPEGIRAISHAHRPEFSAETALVLERAFKAAVDAALAKAALILG